VRDDTRTLWLVLKDLVTGQEKEFARSGRLDLDPVFSADGRALFYASSEGGDLDLWRVDLATGERRALTSEAGLELKPRPAPDGRHLLYDGARGRSARHGHPAPGSPVRRGRFQAQGASPAAYRFLRSDGIRAG